LGNGHLELDSEALSQFLLGKDRGLSFLLPQPGPTLRRHLVGMTMTMVNQHLPGRTSLAIAVTQLGQVVPAERKTQFLAEALKIFSPVETLEKLFLG